MVKFIGDGKVNISCFVFGIVLEDGMIFFFDVVCICLFNFF